VALTAIERSLLIHVFNATADERDKQAGNAE
jgi:hypothetical protein